MSHGESMMFKKPESDYQQPSDPPVSVPRTSPVEPRRENATIGPSISIKGDLMGEEDLIIQGQVEGKVELKQNSVTIGKSGRAKADIHGKIVTIEGEVEGNLFALEQVVVRSTGKVRGDISAPRVTLEDGAKFKGAIDMEVKSAEKTRTGTPSEPKLAVPGSTGGSQAPKPGIYIKTEANAIRS